MANDNNIVFSLVTACKNEEQDIHLAIESALSQSYPYKEIIFVDDSTDRTREIIRQFSDRGVILIPGKGEGCCMARNLGVQRATGDVIVFLTADTRLEPDFLNKILEHYKQGYDWVVVESASFNLESSYSRFVEMQHRCEERKPGYDPYTTQGYSVRRDAALDVGMISGGVYPVNTCRDWSLGKKLMASGYRKIFDRSIVVPHKSPDTFSEYWQVRKTRGSFAVYQPYFMFEKSLFLLFCRFIAKSTLMFFHFVLILPACTHVAAISKYSDRPFKDFLPFYKAYFIQSLARLVGEFQAFCVILQLRRKP